MWSPYFFKRDRTGIMKHYSSTFWTKWGEGHTWLFTHLFLVLHLFLCQMWKSTVRSMWCCLLMLLHTITCRHWARLTVTYGLWFQTALCHWGPVWALASPTGLLWAWCCPRFRCAGHCRWHSPIWKESEHYIKHHVYISAFQLNLVGENLPHTSFTNSKIPVHLTLFK